MEIDEGVENTAFELPLGEFGEEVLYADEPPAGCRREMEGETLVAVERGPNLRMPMGGVVVENDVDGPCPPGRGR